MRYNRKPKGRNDGVCKVLVQDRLHNLAMLTGRLFSKDSFANFSLVQRFFSLSDLLFALSCLELSLVFVVHAFGSPSGFVFFFHVDFLKCICTYLYDIPAPSKGCQMVPAIP